MHKANDLKKAIICIVKKKLLQNNFELDINVQVNSIGIPNFRQSQQGAIR